MDDSIITSHTVMQSDPGVFSELIESFGVKNVQVEELWSLDEENFATLRPIYGLFFLFKYVKNKTKTHETGVGAGMGAIDDSHVFFCPQTINNACGTIALLHVLLNTEEIDIGPTLQDFKTFALDVPSDLRGQVLGQCDPIRIAHNSFARPEPFEIEERVATEDDDVFHFIAFTQVKGRVYEIDGLKPGPIDLGAVPEGVDWTTIASTEISRRIQEYSEKELRFNLMALIQDKRKSALEEGQTALARAVALYSKLLGDPTAAETRSPVDLASSLGISEADIPVNDHDDAMLDAADARRQYDDVVAVIDQAAAVIQSEQARRARWHVENERRRHNFVPFIIELLRQAARNGQLTTLYEKAKEASKTASAAEE